MLITSHQHLSANRTGCLPSPATHLVREEDCSSVSSWCVRVISAASSPFFVRRDRFLNIFKGHFVAVRIHQCVVPVLMRIRPRRRTMDAGFHEL